MAKDPTEDPRQKIRKDNLNKSVVQKGISVTHKMSQ